MLGDHDSKSSVCRNFVGVVVIASRAQEELDPQFEFLHESRCVIKGGLLNSRAGT
jgi:hypothetical protein